MARFITLTSFPTGNRFSLNVDHIYHFSSGKSYEGKPYTDLLTTRRDIDCCVQETSEEILAMINRPSVTDQVNANVKRMLEPYDRDWEAKHGGLPKWDGCCEVGKPSVNAEAPRDPIVLAVLEHPGGIRDIRSCITDPPNLIGPFTFMVNGKSLMDASLLECIEARKIYAVNCDQNGVAYTMTGFTDEVSEVD